MPHVQHLFNSRTSRRVPGRRSDAGQIRLTGRDNRGLITLSEMYAAPGDLLARHLGVAPARLRAVTSRWRNAGLVSAGRLVAGPQWYWLTTSGMQAVGHGWRAGPPPLSRVAHIRAVLAARMWIEAEQSWAQGQAWWRCERRIRAGRVAAPGHQHTPDAEIEWPSVSGSPSPGQTWAVEVELTAKPAARTTRIIAGLLDGPYDVIAYLCSPAALAVVTAAAGRFSDDQAGRIVIRELPPYALMRMPS